MDERWAQEGVPGWLTPRQVRRFVEQRLAQDVLMTWFESDRGRRLAIVTNRKRAMVWLQEHFEDAGEHAIDPTATGTSGGYVLDNGQCDEYPDRDTVELGRALVIIEGIVAAGEPPADAAWSIDR